LFMIDKETADSLRIFLLDADLYWQGKQRRVRSPQLKKSIQARRERIHLLSTKLQEMR